MSNGSKNESKNFRCCVPFFFLALLPEILYNVSRRSFLLLRRFRRSRFAVFMLSEQSEELEEPKKHHVGQPSLL